MDTNREKIYQPITRMDAKFCPPFAIICVIRG